MKLTKKELKCLVERFLFEDEYSKKEETEEPTFEEELKQAMEGETPVGAYNKYREMSKEHPDEEVEFPKIVKKYLKDTLGYKNAEDIKKITFSQFTKDHGADITTLTNAAIIKNDSNKA